MVSQSAGKKLKIYEFICSKKRTMWYNIDKKVVIDDEENHTCIEKSSQLFLLVKSWILEEIIQLPYY